MNIVVCLKRVWGKELFYPVSDDAKFITQLTERPTILDHQLKLCLDKGWKVEAQTEQLNISDYLKKRKKK